MTFVTLLPLGVMQLHRSVAQGYWAARDMEFLTNDLNSLLEWLRLPGDALFIGGGVLPLLWMGIQGVRYRGSHQDARRRGPAPLHRGRPAGAPAARPRAGRRPLMADG